MTSSAAMRAAEEFVAGLDESVAVQQAKARALELRAKAGEVTLRLSEQASDSVEAVLKAATLLQELNLTLHQVRLDLRDSKAQLKKLQELGEVEFVEPEEEKGDDDGELAESEEPARDKMAEYLEAQTLSTEKMLANSATTSFDWRICLSRVSDAMYESMETTIKGCVRNGWIRQFPSWSSERMKWFVQRHFLCIAMATSQPLLVSLKGEELSERQWSRLSEALKISREALKQHGYLFLREVEPTLITLTNTLLSRAQQELDGNPDVDINDNLHPLKRAVSRLVPVLGSDRAVFDLLMPLVFTRLTGFVRTVEKSNVNDVKLELNKILASVRVSIK